MSIETELTSNEHREPVLTITLTGGNDLLRFAINMLDQQCEFARAGRRVIAAYRSRVGAERFDPWARSMLGEHRFLLLHDGGYFEADREGDY